ncbi:MAG: hypothetical protein J6J31_09295 [Thermoguttaceae bacterium]|nr:hypothetical protein [Thermoguttaceae bacterium]
MDSKNRSELNENFVSDGSGFRSNTAPEMLSGNSTAPVSSGRLDDSIWSDPVSPPLDGVSSRGSGDIFEDAPLSVADLEANLAKFYEETAMEKHSSDTEIRLGEARSLSLPEPGKRLQSMMLETGSVRQNINSCRMQAETDRVMREKKNFRNQTVVSDAHMRAFDEALDRNFEHCEQLLDQLSQPQETSRSGDQEPETAVSLDAQLTSSVTIPKIPGRVIIPKQRGNAALHELLRKREQTSCGIEHGSEMENAELDPENSPMPERRPRRRRPQSRRRTGRPVSSETFSSGDLPSEAETHSVLTVESRETAKPLGFWGKCLLGTEIAFGVLLGVGVVAVLMNVQNPLEKRVFHAFQKAVPASLTCESVENDLMKTELTLGPLTMKASNDEDARFDLSIQQTHLALDPISRISRDLRLRSASMHGVEFPNIGTLALQETWRPESIAPVFDPEIRKVLADKTHSLESLRYLEEVKSLRTPEYQRISAEVTRINTEMENCQNELMKELKLEKWDPAVLKSKDAKRPEVIAILEKIGTLRGEAITIQTQWMELNQSVAGDLAEMQEKIALDGEAFSAILHYPILTEEMLANYLFQSDIRKRLAETLDWGKAVSRMAEMGILAENRSQAKSLLSDGTIELFGQTFSFESDWETGIEPECEYSYRGNLRFHSEVLPDELTRDAFVTLACRQKANSRLQTISARIPLANDAFIWGDYTSLPVYAQAHDTSVVIALTVFGEEIRGKITLEMNQVSFDAPEKEAENAQVVYRQYAGKEFPSMQISAEISGTINAPTVSCTSTATAEMMPFWTAALHEMHENIRAEMIASVYERLKNAETAFNGSLEPFYREIILCAEKTDLFKDCPMLRGKIKAKPRESAVEVVPMNLAHLNVDQRDFENSIPTYDPNMGMLPAEQAEPVGNFAGTPMEDGTIRKSIPVKKVAKIEPLTLEDVAGVSQNASEIASPTEIPPIPMIRAAAPAETVQENETAAPQKPELPNLADPVLYSKPKAAEATPLVPMDVPQSRKRSTPLPMMQSTSNLGS